MRCPKCQNDLDLCDIQSLEGSEEEALCRCPKCGNTMFVVLDERRTYLERRPIEIGDI